MVRRMRSACSQQTVGRPNFILEYRYGTGGSKKPSGIDVNVISEPLGILCGLDTFLSAGSSPSFAPRVCRLLDACTG